MSRKLFNHFIKSKFIDIYKNQPEKETLKVDWWKKYVEREKSYKPQKTIK
jgi:hypothetical protein